MDCDVASVVNGAARGGLLYAAASLVSGRMKKKLFSETRRTLAVASACAAFRAVYTHMERQKQTNRGEERGDSEAAMRQRAALAGTAAGLSACLVDPTVCSSVASIWLAVRAVRGFLPSLPYAPTATMCLATAQILTAWVRLRDQIDPSYLRFLDWAGGKTHQMLGTELQSQAGVAIADVCRITHPGTSSHVAQLPAYMVDMLQRSLRLYLPFYLLIALAKAVVNRRIAAKNLVGVAESSVRSSIFLSLYCVAAWAGLCLQRARPDAATGRVTTLSMYLPAAACGLAVLVERKSRRPELAAYCLTYAIDSWYRMLVKRKLLPRSTLFAFLLFSLSAGGVAYKHELLPSFLSHWLLGMPKAKKAKKTADMRRIAA